MELHRQDDREKLELPDLVVAIQRRMAHTAGQRTENKAEGSGVCGGEALGAMHPLAAVIHGC